jgi:hypothetical protein
MMGACMVEVRGTAPTLSASLFGFLVSMRAPSVSPVGLRALFSTRAMRADLEEEKKTKRKEKQIPWLKVYKTLQSFDNFYPWLPPFFLFCCK